MRRSYSSTSQASPDLSERLGPNAVRELLNDFYRLVDEQVNASGGAITSFMGDGAMVLFGLPQSSAADAFNAADCCVGLSRRTTAWLAALPASTKSQIGFKIGAHFGAIVASRLGGKNQQIATTGDTVNVASRLMEVAAGHRAELAVSDDMLKMSGRRLRAPQGRGAQRTDRGTTSRALRLATGLAVAGAAGAIGG